MTENKNHCLAATTECGEWPGQALQDDTIPQGAGRRWGWVGGEGTGDSTTGGVLQLLGGGWERSWTCIIFYVFSLKCLFLKGFQAEKGIFALFNQKSRPGQLCL